MQAIIGTGGKQYVVAPGDVIRVESIGAEAGASVETTEVLAVFPDGGGLLSGDQLANAKVTCSVVSHGRGEKVIVFKFKRKKQYKKTQGHRQAYTELRVQEISA